MDPAFSMSVRFRGNLEMPLADGRYRNVFDGSLGDRDRDQVLVLGSDPVLIHIRKIPFQRRFFPFGMWGVHMRDVI
jgi:hypothetical protein